MTDRFRAILDSITRVRGVQGAALVAREDGVVVADALVEGVRGNAVAALTASLVKRLGDVTGTAGIGEPEFLHLQSRGGVVLAVPATQEIIVVAVADADVNVGLLRLEMLRAAGTVA